MKGWRKEGGEKGAKDGTGRWDNRKRREGGSNMEEMDVRGRECERWARGGEGCV